MLCIMIWIIYISQSMMYDMYVFPIEVDDVFSQKKHSHATNDLFHLHSRVEKCTNECMDQHELNNQLGILKSYKSPF